MIRSSLIYILCLAAPVPVQAASTTASIQTEYGELELQKPELYRLDAQHPCRFSATLVNTTDMAWKPFGFAFKANATKKSGEHVQISGRVNIESLDDNTTAAILTDDHELILSDGCSAEAFSYPLDLISITLYGSPDPGRLAEWRAAKARVAAAKARAAKEKAAAEARRQLLASSPKLNAGTTSTMVGADRKCLKEARETVAKSGLEARKGLSELVRYGCIFLVPSGTAVRILASEGADIDVSILDGTHAGEHGWVSADWVKTPPATSFPPKTRL